MNKQCKYCSGWNDWKGKCDAPFWCPDKSTVNNDWVKDEGEVWKRKMYCEKENVVLESRGMNAGIWIYGMAVETEKGIYIISNYKDDLLNWKKIWVERESHGYFTGHTDFEGNRIYQGDVVRSLLGGQYIEICFGTYRAYYLGDDAIGDSIGFYAVSEGYPDMPIGYPEDYAVRIGNVYQNPELAQRR